MADSTKHSDSEQPVATKSISGVSRLVIDELIRCEAQREVIVEQQKKAEDKFKAAHTHQPGEPVRISGRPATLKYLWVTYKEGLPNITENYVRDPEWNEATKEFDVMSPMVFDNAKVEYLKPLDEQELGQLQELNEMWEREYQDIDSKSRAEELESDRQKLLPRCGHQFKHDTRLFSDFERYTCDKCYYTLETPR